MCELLAEELKKLLEDFAKDESEPKEEK